jgi:hypothetical protein
MNMQEEALHRTTSPSTSEDKLLWRKEKEKFYVVGISSNTFQVSIAAEAIAARRPSALGDVGVSPLEVKLKNIFLNETMLMFLNETQKYIFLLEKQVH